MADPKKIDTGTGGFPIDGKRYSYDTGTENEALWNSGVPWSPGDVKVDDTPKDISPVIKRTLASYLSNTTRGGTPSSPSSVANAYPVKHNPADDSRDLSLSTKDGYASSLNTPGDSQPQFEKSVTPGDLHSRSRFIPNLQRGREKPRNSVAVDGHKLLKDLLPSESKNPSIASRSGFEPAIKTSPTTAISQNSPVRQYYGELPDPTASTEESIRQSFSLSQSMIYNRFNPAATYGEAITPGINPNHVVDQNNDDRNVNLQRGQFQKPGGYILGQSPSPQTAVTKGISFGLLSQIGPVLTMRASGEAGSFSTNVDSKTIGTVAAFLPGSAQLGFDRINKNQLNAREVINSIDEEVKISGTSLINPAGLSWGTMNNVNDEFAGVTDVGMQLLTAALVTTMVVSFGVLGQIIGGTSTAADLLPKTIISGERAGRYHLGKYRTQFSDDKSFKQTESSVGIVGGVLAGFKFSEMIGVQPTSYGFMDCLYAGFLSSFGVELDRLVDSKGLNVQKGLEGLASRVATQVAQSAGYYAVLARAVNRSILSIGDAFKNFGKSVTQGPAAIIKSFLDIMGALRDSKFIRIANLFARIGDAKLQILVPAAITAKATSTGNLTLPAVTVAGMHTLIDANPALSNKMFEAAKPYVVRAWATHRAQDFLLQPGFVTYPSSVKTALGVPSSYPTALSVKTLKEEGQEKPSVYSRSSNGRISTEDREKYENMLEAEYVPFYLHDVRTNEILSFHAFLASLTDGYTSTYDPVDTMGRVEPLKVYKSTARKVDFSFWIVSTSPEDFDSMWIKINKLTTMVYPQFSKGRQIRNGSNSFYAPFSQLVQASPLMRVRIGDLIKSNYSKFNLARIFGYGYKDTAFGGFVSPHNSDDFASGMIKERITESYRSSPPPDTTWYATKLSPSWLQQQGGKQSWSEKPGKGKPQPPVKTSPEARLKQLLEAGELPPKGIVFRVVAENSGEQATVLCRAEFDPSIKPVNEKETEIEKIWTGTDLLDRNIIIPKNCLIPTKKTLQQIDIEVEGKLEELDVDAAQNFKKYHNNVSQFMSDDPREGTNVVARSFRSAGGKGLAGFIESMNFEWPTDKQWEVGQGKMYGVQSGNFIGRRAPTMCKVTIGFSPIHDITPGLDHTGMNRAPIYPVGPLNPSVEYE